MEPTFDVLTALAAGALGGLSDVTKRTIIDTYSALTQAIRRRIGNRELDQMEKAPTSESAVEAVATRLFESGVGSDKELIGMAATLIQQIRKVDPEAVSNAKRVVERIRTNSTSQSNFSGEGQGIAIVGSSDVSIIDSEIIVNRPPSAPSDDTMNDSGRRLFQRERIRVRDLPLEDGLFLRNKSFHDCQLLGPTIFLARGNVVFEHCRFDAPAESIVWVIPDPNLVIGTVGLEHCEFRECDLTGIGLAALPNEAPALIAKLKS